MPDSPSRAAGSHRLTRDAYRRDPVTLARQLLGQRLVRVVDGQRMSGRITETEAYLGIEDRACHTFGGRRTPRVASMWKDGGTAYVYFTYGMHFCLNVVAQTPDQPTAVLIRGVIPEEGLAFMQARRPKAKSPRDWCSGPARLCQAMAIDRRLDGEDLTLSRAIWIESVRRRAYASHRIETTPRIGVGYAQAWAEKPLRFVLKGMP